MYPTRSGTQSELSHCGHPGKRVLDECEPPFRCRTEHAENQQGNSCASRQHCAPLHRDMVRHGREPRSGAFMERQARWLVPDISEAASRSDPGGKSRNRSPRSAHKKQAAERRSRSCLTRKVQQRWRSEVREGPHHRKIKGHDPRIRALSEATSYSQMSTNRVLCSAFKKKVLAYLGSRAENI